MMKLIYTAIFLSFILLVTIASVWRSSYPTPSILSDGHSRYAIDRERMASA